MVAAEKQAEIYNRRYGMKIKILRISQVIGLKQELDLKQLWDLLLYQGIHKRPVNVYGEGKTGRDIIDVKDIATALMCALKKPDLVGIYNIGMGRAVANREIAESYCRILDNLDQLSFLPKKRRLELSLGWMVEKKRRNWDFQFLTILKK